MGRALSRSLSGREVSLDDSLLFEENAGRRGSVKHSGTGRATFRPDHSP